MFGRSKGKIKTGEYVFVSQLYDKFTRLVIGRVTPTDGAKVGVQGFYVIPVGLIDRVYSGQGEGRPNK